MNDSSSKNPVPGPIREVPGQDFLVGGGEMGALTRAFDWTKTPLGAPETWPQSLKTSVRILLSSQHPMFIWWGPDLIQIYNDAYRQTLGPERHPSALGQRGRECWGEIWHIIGPQIEYVMAGKGSTWHVDQLVPVTRFGRREDVWWTYGYSPIDEANGVGGVLVVCTDVTPQHKLTEELRRANMRLADESDRLRALFHQAPGFMCLLSGPKHVFELANASYMQLIGHRDLIGKSIREVLPELEGQQYFGLLDQVYASGEPYVGKRLPVAIQSGPDGAFDRRYVDFVYQPIFGADGGVSGIFVEGSDVTDHVRAEEQHQLLIRELHHRVKNTLATVQALLGSTARSALSIEEFHEAFAGRLVALGKTHSMLTDNEHQVVSVAELLRLELHPYDSTEKRIRIDGPDVKLPVQIAVPVGMGFHELTTNAAKYGALSNDSGTLSVIWRVEGPAEKPILHIAWTEQGGPPVKPPTREGFGSRLLSKVLTAQAHAKVAIDYDPAGLRATIALPIEPQTSN